MEIPNSKNIYKSLCKINKIAKNMANDSTYILSNGIILAYNTQPQDDDEAYPVSIGLISDKLYKDLRYFNYGIYIDGDALYQHQQKYDFQDMSIVKKDNSYYLQIHYQTMCIPDNDYDNKLEKYLQKFYTIDEIIRHRNKDYTTSIRMYNKVLEFRDNYEPIEELIDTVLEFRFVNSDNYIYKKCSTIIKNIENSIERYDNRIDDDIINTIIQSTQPFTMKLTLNDNTTIRLRIMKSLLTPISTKHNGVTFRVLEFNEIYILISKVDMTDVISCNMYQIVKY